MLQRQRRMHAGRKGSDGREPPPGVRVAKKANDALFQTVADQQKALKDDARTLERLQGAAQGATGQLQAIGYANQLASQQANQLLQIRTMLTAQHNAEAARIAAELDAEARGDARAEQMRTWTFRPSPADNY